MDKTKPKGNPNWRKGGPSPNPGGRPRIAEELKIRALKAVDDHVLDAWIDEVQVKTRTRLTMAGPVEVEERGENWVKCSELLAAYGLGKPAQPVEHSGADGQALGITVQFVRPEGAK